MKTLMYWNAPRTLKELGDLFAQTRDYCLRAMANGSVVADGDSFVLSKKSGTLKHNQSNTSTVDVLDGKLIEATAIYNSIARAQKAACFKVATLQQAADKPSAVKVDKAGRKAQVEIAK